MPPLPSLLLVDLLGVKAKWEFGGAASARREFDGLVRLVSAEMRAAPASVEWAELESDTACVACASTNEAIRFACRLYRRAFLRPKSRNSSPRPVWLRGVLVPRPRSLQQPDLRVPRTTEATRTTVNELAAPLLDAIAFEKAGFKGMRLLVHGDLATSRVRTAAVVEVTPTHGVHSLARLSGDSDYPARLEGFVDLLWMATSDDALRQKLRRQMTRRLRDSVRNTDELVHAAATQVVFNEWDQRRQNALAAR